MDFPGEINNRTIKLNSSDHLDQLSSEEEEDIYKLKSPRTKKDRLSARMLNLLGKKERSDSVSEKEQRKTPTNSITSSQGAQNISKLKSPRITNSAPEKANSPETLDKLPLKKKKKNSDETMESKFPGFSPVVTPRGLINSLIELPEMSEDDSEAKDRATVEAEAAEVFRTGDNDSEITNWKAPKKSLSATRNSSLRTGANRLHTIAVLGAPGVGKTGTSPPHFPFNPPDTNLIEFIFFYFFFFFFVVFAFFLFFLALYCNSFPSHFIGIFGKLFSQILALNKIST